MPLLKGLVCSNQFNLFKFSSAQDMKVRELLYLFFQERGHHGDHGEAVQLTVATALKQDIARVALHLVVEVQANHVHAEEATVVVVVVVAAVIIRKLTPFFVTYLL